MLVNDRGFMEAVMAEIEAGNEFVPAWVVSPTPTAQSRRMRARLSHGAERDASAFGRGRNCIGQATSRGSVL